MRVAANAAIASAAGAGANNVAVSAAGAGANNVVAVCGIRAVDSIGPLTAAGPEQAPRGLYHLVRIKSRIAQMLSPMTAGEMNMPP